MGVGVGRLGGTFGRRELLPEVNLIVEVPGALGEHGAEDLEVWTDRLRAVGENGRQALRQESCRGVPGQAEAPGVGVERGAEGLGGARPDVDDVEPRAGSDLEGEFKKWHSSSFYARSRAVLTAM